MAPLRDTAHAKINLFLHVTGRRNDGYHLLDSLAVFAGAGDELTLSSADENAQHNLTIQGPFSALLSKDEDSDNLVLKAARALQTEAQRNGISLDALPAADIILEKHLPVASGIGGGSADAACALRLLCQFWHIDLQHAHTVAPTLGADVPVCLAQQATRMEGIGEILTPSPALPSMGMLLVNPGVSVSTPSIFKRLAITNGITKRPPLSLPRDGWNTLEELVTFLRTTGNDLQAHAIAQEPVISTVIDLLHTLPGVHFSRMSGSGATCFALFKSASEAQKASQILAAHPASKSWWQWAGPVL